MKFDTFLEPRLHLNRVSDVALLLGPIVLEKDSVTLKYSSEAQEIYSDQVDVEGGLKANCTGAGSRPTCFGSGPCSTATSWVEKVAGLVSVGGKRR